MKAYGVGLDTLGDMVATALHSKAPGGGFFEDLSGLEDAEYVIEDPLDIKWKNFGLVDGELRLIDYGFNRETCHMYHELCK